MRTFQQSTDLATKRQYIDHFLDWSSSTHKAKYITGNIDSQEFTNILSGGKNLLADFSRIIDDFLAAPREKKDEFVEIGPVNVTAEHADDHLKAIYRLFKIYWLGRDITQNGISAPVQLLSFGYPTINCHPGSDKRYGIIFLAKPQEQIPYVYIDYEDCEYKFYEDWEDVTECTEPEDIMDAFPNFTHKTFHCVYEWIEMWRDGCNPHNIPVYNGIKKYHKKATKDWGNQRTSIAVWHLSYYDAIHRQGMTADMDMLWDIQQQDDYTLWIGDTRFTKSQGIWKPDNANFESVYNPLSPIDKYTPYSSRWF